MKYLFLLHMVYQICFIEIITKLFVNSFVYLDLMKVDTKIDGNDEV